MRRKISEKRSRKRAIRERNSLLDLIYLATDNECFFCFASRALFDVKKMILMSAEEGGN